MHYHNSCIGIFSFYLSCHSLGTIYRPMPPAGTSETYLKTAEASPQVAFHRGGDHLHGLRNKFVSLSPLLQEFHHGSIQSGKRFVLFISARIMHAPTVEHESATIAAVVFRIPQFVREAEYSHGKSGVFGWRIETRVRRKFATNASQFRIPADGLGIDRRGKITESTSPRNPYAPKTCSVRKNTNSGRLFIIMEESHPARAPYSSA